MAMQLTEDQNRSGRLWNASASSLRMITGWSMTKAVISREFYRAMADGGWLGIAMPEEFGGAGLGVTEASIMMHTVAKTRGAMALPPQSI